MSINIAGSEIIVVPLGSDHSTSLYRAFGLVEQLTLARFPVRVMNFRECASNCAGKVVILQRIGVSPGLVDVFEKVKRNARVVLFDVDDYLFDVEHHPVGNRTSTQFEVDAMRYTASRSSGVICSTPNLAALVSRELKVPTYVRRNRLSQAALAVVDKLSPPRECKTIGYCCGSATHNNDFPVCIPALTKVLREARDWRLAVIGGSNLSLPSSFLEEFGKRVRLLPYVRFLDLLKLIHMKFSISIAPLKSSLFNSCKSEVKYLEASVVGVPSVCSAVGGYPEVVKHGETGFLAKDTSEWVAALQQLIASRGIAKNIGGQAYWACRESNHTGCAEDVQRLFMDKVVLPPVKKSIEAPAIIKGGKRLRILQYVWHVGHQWELHHLPHDFILASCASSNQWSYNTRPLRKNAKIVAESGLDFKSFDLAIIHFDEDVLCPELTLGVKHRGWGSQFVRWVENLQMPKVGICHGTPFRHGSYSGTYPGDPWEIDEVQRAKLVSFVGDMPVVVNSVRAQQEWGFCNSRVIYHGFDSSEYPITSGCEGTLTSVASFKARPWYVGAPFVRSVLDSGVALDYVGRGPIDGLRVVSAGESGGPVDNNEFAEAKFSAYKQLLAKYRVFFNPTWFSPMPRTRAEAMLCGECIVTTNFYDEDQWIRNGVNGFHSSDVEELIDVLKFLERNPDVASRVGLAGREFADREFSRDRYLDSWTKLIGEVVR